MLNQFIIVGKIDTVNKEDDKSLLIINVPRSYKNENGEYESDTLKIQVYSNISDALNDYCKHGDVVGVKGRIQEDNILIAEKVSFLSSKSE